MSDTRALLRQLSEAHGVQTTYQGQDGATNSVSDATLVAILEALGCSVEADGAAGLQQAWDEIEQQRWNWMVPATTVMTEGSETEISVHIPDGELVGVHLELETGEAWPLEAIGDFTDPALVDGVWLIQVTFRLPDTVPLGYHRISATASDGHTADAHLIVVPQRLTTAEAYRSRRGWGVAAQLYSVRSEHSWGIGDFADLASLGELTASHGGDFVLTNPLHASEPVPPVMDSPYSPVTRRFLNPLYLRIENIPEYLQLPREQRIRVDQLAQQCAAANDDAGLLQRNDAYAAKLEALRLMYSYRDAAAYRAKDFARFCADVGAGLDDFALWSAIRAQQLSDSTAASEALLWPGSPAAPEAASWREHSADQIEFYRWLQFLCDEQLATAQHGCRELGMRTGVMVDLAVGASRGTADAWMHDEALVKTMSVGAPPDMYNQLGQDWSQHPWNPNVLEHTGYRPYRDMLRTVLRQAGAVRVDHILGMFRLWWIPDGLGPREGAYVRYNHHAMIGILILEAQRAGAVVVGEDLGTFEPWVQLELADRGLLGTNILWFEQNENGPVPPEQYREQCLAAVNTHDLPPTVGYLREAHLQLREQLSLLTSDAHEERVQFRRGLHSYLDALADRGLIDASRIETLDWWNNDDVADVVVAMYRYLTAAPSMLHSVALVDAVGDQRIQNQPGTTQEQYPNWQLPLTDADGDPVLLESLAQRQLPHRLFQAVDGMLRGES